MKKLMIFLFIPIGFLLSTIDSKAIHIQKDFPLIHGIADPMTGEVVYSKVDHVIKGAEPIVIRKFYRNNAPDSALDGGWIFFPELYLGQSPQILNIENMIYITDLNGYRQRFYFKKALGYEHIIFIPYVSGDNDFYRNTLSENLSARTNPRNMILELMYEKWAILTKPDGTIKHYKFQKNQKVHDCINGGDYHYYLEKEIKPNKNTVYYEYDDFLRLKKIQTKDPSSTKIYATATFEYEDKSKGDKNRNFSIWANGKKIGTYKFWRPDEKENNFAHDSFFLEETCETFLNTNLRSQWFKYDSGIIEKHDPQKKCGVYYEKHKKRLPYLHSINEEGNCKSFTYYQVQDNFKINGNPVHIKSSYDHRYNRIKALYVKNPFFDEKIKFSKEKNKNSKCHRKNRYCEKDLVPEQKENPQKLLYLFNYILEDSKTADKNKKIKQTQVKNYQNNDMSIFTFDEERKPLRMEQIFYNGLDGDNRYVEQYYWKSKERGLYLEIASVLCRDENDDNSSMTIEYEYYKGGNVKQKKLLANLSGACKKECQENCDEYSRPHDIGKDLCLGKCADRCNRESYFIKYTYTDDGFNMVKTIKEDSNLSIDYTYKLGTNLLESKITYDEITKEIYKREYFEYNEDNILIRKIIDNGKTHNSQFCTNEAGTICKISEFIPRAEEIAYNLPEIVKEKCLDNGVEHTLLIHKYEYNDRAEITKEHIHDTSDNYLYTLAYEYAENGLLLSKTDPIGRQIKYTYDTENGWIFYRPKTIENAALPYIESYTYDRVGNLQQKLQKGKGVERCYKYGYDIHRMRTSEEDFRGRISTFAYDGKGNQTKQQIFGNEGNLVIQRKYDAFGNEILLIDAKGNKTTKKYNSYGSVIQIDYPDDTSETFRYTLNNLLRKHVDQRGIETIYEYDSFGNQRKKTIVFEGKEIAYEERGYDGFILTWLKDLEGNTIKYFYDGAGRKIAEEFTDVKTKEKQRTEYTYDVYSNLATEKILNGANTLISVTIKDVLGRVKEERLEDEKGKVYSKKTYTYDGYDNKEKESRFIDGKEVKTIFTYDSFNRLTSQRDIDDTAYSIEYFDQYENEYGKRVLKKVDTDPLGIRTIRIFDQFDQIRSLEKKSPSGTVLSLEEFQYDKNFNPTIQKSFVYFQGKLDREVELEREYDSMNRLKKLIEAANTEDRKITIYTYFPNGQLKQLTKPDGVKLNRTYDPLGYEKTLYSYDEENPHRTEGMISYAYEYTKLGHLRSSTNLLTECSTKRELDGKGLVHSETLENGLTNKYEYDRVGRLTRIIFFDGSIIEKEYDPAYLRKVTRRDRDDKIIHTHYYELYDLSGNLLLESIGNEIITYSFDHLGRIISTNSPYFTQYITEYDLKGKITEMRINNDLYSFEYDDLEQLISEKGRFNHDYLFDSHFNRLKKDKGDYKVNHLNQIEQTQHAKYIYDHNGNTSIRNSNEDIEFAYDALDRLISVRKKDQEPINYIYDSLHRRAIKQQGNQKSLYLYQDQNEVGEVKENTLKTFRTLGLGSYAELGSAVTIEVNGKVYIPIHDLSLNVAELISKDSKTVESYRYSAFGQEEINTLYESSINPWRFSSKRTDSETGYVYFGRRYYDPDLGRWITKDPKGYKEGINLYAYVMNSPLNNFDLYGLERFNSNSTWFNTGAQLESYSKGIVDFSAEMVYGLLDLPFAYSGFLGYLTGLDQFRPGSKLLEVHYAESEKCFSYNKFNSNNRLSYYVTKTSLEIGTLFLPGTNPGNKLPQLATAKNIAALQDSIGLAKVSMPLSYLFFSVLNKAKPNSQGNQNIPTKYKSFTKDNYRHNLKVYTGINPPKSVHVHHVFTQKFEIEFRKRGINIHEPNYLTWWEAKPHLKAARGYNAKWERFFYENPEATANQILEVGREIMGDYGIKINY